MMFAGLQIPYRRERWLVGLADLASAPLKLERWRHRDRIEAPRRILLLRLERIGDLLMVLDAIATLRAALPDAEIDLAIGSWNRDLGALIPGIRRLEIVDVPWLARDRRGESAAGLLRHAWRWRGEYDLVINFEPDIRSNMLTRLTGAPRRIGYWTGGGGAFLTEAGTYDPTSHVADNAAQLIAKALAPIRPRTGRPFTSVTGTIGPTRSGAALLQPDRDAYHRASRLLEDARGALIGVHVSGGRPSKQWHLDRFAAVAQALAERHQATIVLTGSAGDRRLVDEVKENLSGIPVIDVAGAADLPTLAALLSKLDVLVTGDTGPMHLAAAMGTPVVALFGPSDPRRYGPRGTGHRVIRIDLPCSPCGQVRLPPVRCRGHVPDCLHGIDIARVVDAASEVIEGVRSRSVP